ncbi:hypothetical protein ACXWQW_09465, partial [Streptococcus pyogenes]
MREIYLAMLESVHAKARDDEPAFAQHFQVSRDAIARYQRADGLWFAYLPDSVVKAALQYETEIY